MTCSDDGSTDHPYATDRQLLQTVLDQPNVRSVDVILGADDKVIRSPTICKFLNDFPTVNVVEMPGLAHDPFEEDPEAFVETVQEILLQRRKEE